MNMRIKALAVITLMISGSLWASCCHHGPSQASPSFVGSSLNLIGSTAALGSLLYGSYHGIKALGLWLKANCTEDIERNEDLKKERNESGIKAAAALGIAAVLHDLTTSRRIIPFFDIGAVLAAGINAWSRSR